MTVTLDGMTVKMPPTWGATQLAQGFQQSVVGSLKSGTPMNMGEVEVPQYEGGFEVGYTAEMGVKPVSDVSLTTKSMGSHKFAGIVVVSKEFAQRNPAQMLQFIEQDMQNAVARQVDYAIFYGKSARTGTLVPGMENNYINATAQRVQLAAGDLVPQLLAGYDAVINGSRGELADPNGYAFDPRLRSRIALAVQQQVTLPGAPAPMPNLSGNQVDTIGGIRAAYGRTVSGRVGTNPDTGVRGFTGDFNAGLRWGFVDRIDIQRSNEATILGTDGKPIYLFQQNAMALLIEFRIGWAVMDSGYFAAFDDAVAV